MPPCLSLSGLASRRQIDPICSSVLYLISQPRFLHFTLNHYTRSADGFRLDGIPPVPEPGEQHLEGIQVERLDEMVVETGVTRAQPVLVTSVSGHGDQECGLELGAVPEILRDA